MNNREFYRKTIHFAWETACSYRFKKLARFHEWRQSIWVVPVLILLITSLPQAAQAAPLCRAWGDHEICLLTIKRSAKYYWEYRVVLSVDGEPRPLETYDCQHRVRIPAKGKPVPFAEDGPGPLICQWVER